MSWTGSVEYQVRFTDMRLVQEVDPSDSPEDAARPTSWPPESDSPESGSFSVSSESEDQASPAFGEVETGSAIPWAGAALSAEGFGADALAGERPGTGAAAADAFNASSLAPSTSTNKSIINFAPPPSGSFAGL